MPAASTDKFKKARRKFSARLAATINDVATSLTLDSGANLDTDTAITLVIDAVDSNGNATPTREEVVTGVWNGTAVTGLLRGRETTVAQQHYQGAVVTMYFTETHWDDLIDGILVNHNQDGTPKTSANLTGDVTSVGNATTYNNAVPVLKGGTGATTITGTGANVLATSPALVTPTGIVKGDVGLGNVDNTSDANKPVSTAQATSIATKKTDSMNTNKLLGRGTAAVGAIEEITLGTGLSFTGTTLNAAASGTGDVVGPASSVDSEIALFSGVTGKLIKRAATTGILKGATGVISAATSGTDYAPGTSGNTTGIVKSTTTTGALTTAVAADFPTLNQSTTGNAATVTTNANLTGDVTSAGNATTLTNAPVIAKVLTGFTSGAGTVAATDSILQATQKLNGNVALKSPKFATYTVGVNGDYSTIQAALDVATASGRILLLDNAYTITTGLLIKGSNVTIEGNGPKTVISCNGATVTTLIKSNSTTYTGFKLLNVKLSQTNATVQGIAVDASNMALSVYEGLFIDSFGTALYLNDTANLTFYNRFADIFITSCNNGIVIGGTNPVNDNMFMNIRTSLIAGGAGKGLKLVKGQSNNFYNCNFEPGTGAGITGVSLEPIANGDVYDTNFYGVYVENNATNVIINSNTQRTAFFGGQIVAAITTNMSDSGQDTQFFGADIGYALSNQYSASTYLDATNASKTLAFLKNNTSFAHVSSHLFRAQLLNSSDSSNVIRIENPGTGKNISSTNGTSETFSVNLNGSVVAGNVATTVANKTAAYTVTATDSVITTSGAGAAFTITLPTAASIAGRQYTIKRQNATNNTTVACNGAETIDGATTKILGSAYSGIKVVSDGTNWVLVSTLGTVT